VLGWTRPCPATPPPFLAPLVHTGSLIWLVPPARPSSPPLSRLLVAPSPDKVVSLVQLPEVLCIHLKRFNFHHMWGSKASTEVSFPLTGLDMGPYLQPATPPDLLTLGGAGSAGGVAPSLPPGHTGASTVGPSSSRGCAVAPVGTMGEPAPVYDLVSIVQHIGSLHGQWGGWVWGLGCQVTGEGVFWGVGCDVGCWLCWRRTGGWVGGAGHRFCSR
jgi:hypothetical protein